MPYTKKSELPEAVQALPPHAAEVWMAAFNAAFKQYDGDEAKSNATAWAAVKDAGYEKGDDGKWHRVKEAAVTEAIKRLRPVDPALWTVQCVGESAVVLVNADRSAGLLPYYEDGKGGYVFGQFRYPPVPEADLAAVTVTAESAPVRGADFTTPQDVDRFEMTLAEDVLHRANPEAGEWPVVIIEEGENYAKRRAYTAKAIESVDPAQYVGVPMHFDHAGAEGKQSLRSIRDFAGRIIDAWHGVAENGRKQIRGMAHFFDPWVKERMRDPHFRTLAGLSHVADVAGYESRTAKGPMRVIDSIVKPYAVDLVSLAAFGGKVMESAGIDRRMEDLTMLETLTVADLTAHRPDLVDALKEQFRVQESDDPAAIEAARKLAEAESRAAALEKQLIETRVREAAAAAVAEHKIPEPARKMVVDRVVSRLGTQQIAAETLSATVSEAVKAEVEFGKTLAPSRPDPELPSNRGGKTDRDALQAKFDASLGVKSKAAD